MTLYVPGPVLQTGWNEVVILELEAPGRHPAGRAAVQSVAEPDFHGPRDAAYVPLRSQTDRASPHA